MNTEEQRLDVIKNCDILLDGILKPFYQKDNTPEGRMITQLKWLKERAENHDLQLPVDPGKLSTLSYVYTNGEIVTLASNPDDPHSIRVEVEIFTNRLLSLTDEGQLLLKPAYYPYAIRYINALINLLKTSPRPLDQYEQGLIPELKQLKQLLADGKIEPPLMSYFPEYLNFNEVNMYRVSVGDLPNGKILTRTVANLLFEGIRPDSWLTPEDADKDTQNLP